MTDEPHDPSQDDQESAPEPQVPASVTFMEMMRHAAAQANPPPEVVEEPVEVEAEPEPASPLPKPESEEDRRRRTAAAMEVQRIERVQRRRTRRRRRTVGVVGGCLRSFIVVIVAAGLIATILVWWTPTQFIAHDVRSELGQAQAAALDTPTPTLQATPNWLRKVGVVSGHRGPELDPGAVCPDGLTEAEITFSVAQLVVRDLRGQGFSVDLLDEFDPRLQDYQAAALVSIHANTCQDFGEPVSGFLVSAAAARVTARGEDDILVDCLARYYQQATGLEYRTGVTEDMTNYHSFREIDALTPAAIIETGFLLADRDLLAQHPDSVAHGIANGILCYLQPGQVSTPAASPLTPTVQAS